MNIHEQAAKICAALRRKVKRPVTADRVAIIQSVKRIRNLNLKRGPYQQLHSAQLVTDLLADLMHYCDSINLDMGELENIATKHYWAELYGDRDTLHSVTDQARAQILAADRKEMLAKIRGYFDCGEADIDDEGSIFVSGRWIASEELVRFAATLPAA